ncbi:MAG: S41 family peptidase, partial [Bacteroidales bacterium]|nr:S41 family peptidase [Bacteroidales bacterium]
FSAANVFAAVLKECPQVTVIGARTGGGGGMPLSYELPFGWGVRMSAAPIHDARGNCIENGVDPTPGYEVNFTDEDSAAGRDPILDTAIAFIAAHGF